MVSFRLRLDDGSFISRVEGSGASTSSAARTNAPTAFEQGLLSEKDVARLEKLVQVARQLAPPIRTIEPASGPSALKKARVDSGHFNDSFSLGGDWITKCKGILERISRNLGKDKQAFWPCIDAKLVPDYYNHIKEPIFFGQIEEKLKKRVYSSPLEFHNDMTRSLSNCLLYNPIGDYFRGVSERINSDYERAWASSGFMNMDPNSFQAGNIDSGPGKRSKAGVARAKFDPDIFDAAHTPKPKSTSKNAKVKKEAPISEARKREMGEQMQSEAMEQHMEEFMSLLPQHLLEGADGEFELDFEALDEATLHKMDSFLRRIFGPPAGTAGAPPDLIGSDELEELMDEDDEDLSLSVELDDESDDD